MNKKILAIIIPTVLVVVGIIITLCVTLFLTKKIKKLDISPDFTEMELNTSMEYSFTVTCEPKEADLKGINVVSSNPDVIVKLVENKIYIKTGEKTGTESLYVENSKCRSNVVSYTITAPAEETVAENNTTKTQALVDLDKIDDDNSEEIIDSVTKEVKYVKVNADSVNVRSQSNTDCDVIGKTKKNEVFTLVGEEADWSIIEYNGQNGYIKTEYLEITDNNNNTSNDVNQNETAEKQSIEETSADNTTGQSVAASAPVMPAAYDEATFESLLNAGQDLTGATVTFVAMELHPDSVFGYNIYAGQHLNFVSTKNPHINQGDVVTVKVTDISSIMGSWIISYSK